MVYIWDSNPIYEAFKPVKQLFLKCISVKMKNYFVVCFLRCRMNSPQKATGKHSLLVFVYS